MICSRSVGIAVFSLNLALGVGLSLGGPIIYSTYFGAIESDGAYAVAVDDFDNAYVAGSTLSTNRFPTLNAIQPQSGGREDIFVAKFDSKGQLVFSTYLGGAGIDVPLAIAVEPSGNVLVAGQTHSVDFPVTDDAWQPLYGGGTAFGTGDGFIARLSNDGSCLLYSSYLGGAGDDVINSIVVDGAGNILLAGQTGSKSFPTKNALQRSFGGGDTDAFIAKFDATLTNLIFSTYLGGRNRDEQTTIAVDPGGFIYICGETLSTNFPVTPNAFESKFYSLADSESWNGFAAKLRPDGSAMPYSTYLGIVTRSSDTAVMKIAVDSAGRPYLAGGVSAMFGNVSQGFQRDPGRDGLDAFVAKLKQDGSGFDWFSYLGGSGEDLAYSLALDRDTDVIVMGITASSDFPTHDGLQNHRAGSLDVFVAKLSTDGKSLLYSTYFGGTEEDWGYGIALDRAGNVIVAGQTMSTNFPTLAAIQATNSNANIPRSIPPNFNYDQPLPWYVFDGLVTKLVPVVQRPVLKLARSGNSVLISWLTNAVDFSLEWTDSITSPAVWKTTANVPLVIGDQYTVVDRVSGAGRLYRLRRP